MILSYHEEARKPRARCGFNKICLRLHIQSGWMFDSYDTNAKGTNVSDYNCAVRNPRTGQVAPSRRLEAWYQGLVDFKLLKWCRLRLAEREKRGEDVSKIKAKLERLIRDADVPRGDFEKIRVRLANIARMLAK